MYDFIIIGGGCSGLSAAMYGTRLGLKTLTLAELPGGLITTTNLVENWPGLISTTGPDLAISLQKHAKAAGAEIKNEIVIRIEKLPSNAKGGDFSHEDKNPDNKVSNSQDRIFQSKTANNSCPRFKVITSSNEYETKSILLATGTKHRKLGIPGELELENRGVSFCALCDGAFFKNKIVCVVGGGDSAAKEASFLTEHASKVYLIVRKNLLRAEPLNKKRTEENKKIEILYETELAEIIGKDSVEKVKLKNGKELGMQGVFVAIGHIPQTQLAKDLGVELNEKGEIKTNRKTETNIPGVFAAGDCTDSEFKQAITGSAEGVTASYYAFHICAGEAGF